MTSLDIFLTHWPLGMCDWLNLMAFFRYQGPFYPCNHNLDIGIIIFPHIIGPCEIWIKFYVILQLILSIYGWGISCEIALWWILLYLTNDKSTLVQVMAWCWQATSHYLSQWWLRFKLSYGITGPQWVKEANIRTALISVDSSIKLNRSDGKFTDQAHYTWMCFSILWIKLGKWKKKLRSSSVCLHQGSSFVTVAGDLPSDRDALKLGKDIHWDLWVLIPGAL